MRLESCLKKRQVHVMQFDEVVRTNQLLDLVHGINYARLAYVDCRVDCDFKKKFGRDYVCTNQVLLKEL